MSPPLGHLRTMVAFPVVAPGLRAEAFLVENIPGLQNGEEYTVRLMDLSGGLAHPLRQCQSFSRIFSKLYSSCCHFDIRTALCQSSVDVILTM